LIGLDDVSSVGNWLRQTLSGFGLHGLVLDGVLAFIAVFVVANFALANAGLMSFVWRREMASIQDRRGPNRVGPNGLFQFIADLIKLILKQAMVPRGADRLLQPVAEHEGQHHADGGGAVVARGGHGVIRMRLARTPAPLRDVRTASGRARTSFKRISDLLGNLGDRDVRPDRC